MPNSSTIYINLEDDVQAIVTRLKREKAAEVTLVCPKRCLLFSDEINLKLLKKQADMLEKLVSILTMDEKGQAYARAAGFDLKVLPKSRPAAAMSDIRVPKQADETPATNSSVPVAEKETPGVLAQAAQGIKTAVKTLAAPVMQPFEKTPEALPQIVVKRQEVPKFEVRDTVFPESLEGAPLIRPDKPDRTQSRTITALAVLSLIIILLIVFVVLPKAEVVVYARTEALTRDMEVQMASGVTEPNAQRLHLPAKKITETLESSGQFQSQGKREAGNQARGTVRIYNFTGAPITLRASTTALKIGNKSYVLAKDVTYYRATTYKNAQTREINPASLGDPVEVMALEGGDSSNAPSGTRLEITNQVFGSRPQLLYAQVEGAVTGGTSRFVSFISEQDLASAQTELAQKLLQEYKDKLASEGLILLDKAFTTETVSFVPEKPAGTETPSFTALLKVNLTGLVFEKGELERLVEDRVTQSLSSEKNFKSKDNNIAYKLISADLTSELGAIAVHFEGKAVKEVNLENVKSELVGKSKEEANDILRDKADIDKIEMTLAPAWQKNFPWFAQKIDIKVVE
jgi:hypothetical protein